MISRYFKLSLLMVSVIAAGDSAGNGAERTAATNDPIKWSATDWPWWRGPQRNGAADPLQKPPLHWSNTENIVWKTPIPGKGHGSPTIIGDRIYLANANEEAGTQSILCLDRATGKLLWDQVVHKGGLNPKGNKKSSLASGSVAGDGTRLFMNFFHGGQIWVSALDAQNGKILWQKAVTDFAVHQGYGPSPTVYGSLVIVSTDNVGHGVLTALDRATGEVVWKQERPKTHNYTSPIVLHVAGKDQVICTGCSLIASYDPLTGKKNWEVPGSTDECVTSTVTDGELVFSTGGYPRNHMEAIKADGSKKIVWSTTNRLYVPSMLIKDGYLYGTQDGGIATCWKADTGKKIWDKRLGGTFSASPVLVGDLIYATDEAGKTTIFKANPQKYEEVATNQLAEENFATPTIVGGKLYARSATTADGKRQEFLYCVGEK
ncbi:MAG: PQQ-binding-like beta-propeller repeat protein [Planctomycetales bacterium]